MKGYFIMTIERIVKILSDYLDINESEITDDTMLFLEYDLEDEDIEKIIKMLEEEFDISIDMDEFCELSSVEDFAEYIESLC